MASFGPFDFFFALTLELEPLPEPLPEPELDEPLPDDEDEPEPEPDEDDELEPEPEDDDEDDDDDDESLSLSLSESESESESESALPAIAAAACCCCNSEGQESVRSTIGTGTDNPHDWARRTCSSSFGMFFRCSRRPSVSPPRPMEVKKLTEKRVSFGFARGNSPSKYSAMYSSCGQTQREMRVNAIGRFSSRSRRVYALVRAARYRHAVLGSAR